MTSSHDGPPPDSGSAAILRALGSLMAALGNEPRTGSEPSSAGAESRPSQRPAAPQPPFPEPTAEAPRTPWRPAPEVGTPPDASGSPPQDAALLLADARERAQHILDESIERAALLLTPRREVAEQEQDAVRRSVADLVSSMRDVERRLGRIELLLESRGAGTDAGEYAGEDAGTDAGEYGRARPREPQPPDRSEHRAGPVDDEAEAEDAGRRDERRTGGLSVVSLDPVRQSGASEEPPHRGGYPAGVPASAMPPSRGAAQPAPAADAREDDDEDEHEDEYEARRPASRPAPIATFTPSDGSVLLRATPVPGFQGLMRLQDALGRLTAVRQATVEAYAQGEARLRLDLATEVDSDELASGLAQNLERRTEVAEASEIDRTIRIMLA